MANTRTRSTGTGNVSAALIFFGGAALILLAAWLVYSAFTTSAQTLPTTTPVVATPATPPASGGISNLSVSTTIDTSNNNGSINISVNNDAAMPITVTFDFATGVDQTKTYTTTSFKLNLGALPPAGISENVTVTASNGINTLSTMTIIRWDAPTAIPTATIAPTNVPPTMAPVPTNAPAPTATTVPTAMPITDPATLKTGSKNLPAKAESVELTGKDHKNSIGLGTEAFLAEPGVYTCEASKCPENDIKFGSAHAINPDTQYNLSAAQQWANVPEGGWGMVSGNFFTMTAPDGKEVTISAGPLNSAFLFIRGKYRGDGDLNSQVQFSNFMSGHALWTRLPMGAFISEGYATQNINSAFDNSVNCGDDGCQRVLVGYIDLNTGAFGTWWVDRATDGSLTWTKDKTNY